MNNAEIINNLSQIRVIEAEGAYWSDGWMKRSFQLSAEVIENLMGFKVSVWNPDLSVRYAGNVVTVTCNKHKWTTSALAMGERADLNIGIALAKGEKVELNITSANSMQADVMDARERGVVLVSMTCLPVPDQEDIYQEIGN